MSKSKAINDTGVACEKCGWTGKRSSCWLIGDLFKRVKPGNIFPAGQCPQCGALCHSKYKESASSTESVVEKHLKDLGELLDAMDDNGRGECGAIANCVRINIRDYEPADRLEVAEDLLTDLISEAQAFESRVKAIVNPNTLRVKLPADMLIQIKQMTQPPRPPKEFNDKFLNLDVSSHFGQECMAIVESIRPCLELTSRFGLDSEAFTDFSAFVWRAAARKCFVLFSDGAV